MSVIRNRELSQFGSFIYIEDSTKAIGITTEQTPYVGIGTPHPSVKLEVVGDTNIKGNLNVIEGNINAESFTLNGNPLTDATIQYWLFGSNGNDIYRLAGNIGIGTSVFTQKLTVNGNISAGQFISTVANGTAPFQVLSNTQVTNLNASFLRGKLPPSGDIVGTTDAQSLSNKTLTSPIINNPTLNSPSISSNGVTISGATSGTLSVRTAAVASGTLTLPSATDTLVARNTTDTFTNKTIAASSNTITGLTNQNLSGSAGITNGNLANSTISGISLGGNLNSLSFGAYLTSSGTYNGSESRTVSVLGSSSNQANTLVARDINGDFSAGSIQCSNLTTSFDINSNSDESLKTNIKTIDNSLEIISSLRGVSFDWKETGYGSYGVIAQELEKVLPQLVKGDDIKSVNYNGLIGVLIEAIKAQQMQINILMDEVKSLKNER